jgi:taurine dioxygenase
MRYETITLRRLSGALGAEIGGVDLRKPLGNRQWSEIHRAFLAHCAIDIRDQDLAPPEILRFARDFAEQAFYPFVEGLPEYPQIFELRKEPDQKENVSGVWHSDTTYTERPPIGTMLYNREAPAYAATRWSRTSISRTRRCRRGCGRCSTASSRSTERA